LTLSQRIADVVGADAVLPDVPARYLVDETETRDSVGEAQVVVLPRSVEQVAAVVAVAYREGVPIVPRGGGTGYAGGAVPGGGIVLSLERLNRVRRLDPLEWRMEVEAGVTTAEVHRRARESGLYFPPDPGAAEQSQIGGNIATNAGGPHAFKYGTTGAWVTGIEAVVAPGEIIRVGGPVRKDVAGYDLKSLLVGSEGTLGVITAAWLRLIPSPEASAPAVAFFADPVAGCEGIATLLGSGILLSALEFVDEEALAATPPQFIELSGSAFAVLFEADGSRSEVDAVRAEAVNALDESATAIFVPRTSAEVELVWRWREGMTAGVTARHGGKVSEDIVVPVDRLCDAILGTRAIGRRHGLESCSWGHAGDGNLHSTFMIRRGSPDDLERADRAAHELFQLAIELDGSISGEHGIGTEKCGQLELSWGRREYGLHTGVKALFDPMDLMNPGKKR
jgi:glycolate oxidase subunit GlcD